MKVRAKVISGRDESFEVSEEITVEQFRRLVSERISISVEKIRLLFQGRFLSDKAKTLAHYGVQDGFVIHVVEQMNLVNNMPVYADEVNQQRRRNTGGSYSNRRILVPPVRSVITFTRGGAVTEPSRLQDLVRRAIDELPIIPEEVRSGLRIDMTATGLTVNMPALNCPHVPSQALERILSIDRVLKYMRFFRTSAEKENGICTMIDSLLDSTHWPPDNIIKATRAFLLDMDNYSEVNMSTREYESSDRESAEYQGRYQSYPISGEEQNMSPYVARHALASDLVRKHDELHEEYMKFQPHIKRYNHILSSHHVFNIEERDYLLTDPRANILCVYSQHVRKNLHKYSHALHIISELNVKLEDPLPRRLYPQNRVFQFSNPSQGQISFEIVDPHNPNRIETARHQAASDMFRCTTNEPTSFDGLITLYPTGYHRSQSLLSTSRATNGNRTLAGTRRPIIVDGQIEMPPPVEPVPAALFAAAETGSDSLFRRRDFGTSLLGSPRTTSRILSSASSILEGSAPERSSSARAPENRPFATFEIPFLTQLNPVGIQMRSSNIPNRQSFSDDYHLLQNRNDPSTGTQQPIVSQPQVVHNRTDDLRSDSVRRPFLSATVVSAFTTAAPSTNNESGNPAPNTNHRTNSRVEDAVRDYHNNSEQSMERHAQVLYDFLSNSVSNTRVNEPGNVYERLYRQIMDAGLTNIGRFVSPEAAVRCASDVDSDPATLLPSILSYAIRGFVLPQFLSNSTADSGAAASETSNSRAAAPNANATTESRNPDTFLDSLTSILDRATNPMVGGVEIRLEPQGVSRFLTNFPRMGQSDRDDPNRPLQSPAILSSLFSQDFDSAANTSDRRAPGTQGQSLPFVNMRQRTLRSDPSSELPPLPIDPFLNCDSLLDLSGADSAASGSMFHQISSSRMFNNSFRESMGGRRRMNLPSEPYGVPTLSEIRMALTHNGEIISPSDEKCVILIIQHAIRWILLLMRENDISRVEETAGRSRQVVGIRQLQDEIMNVHADSDDRHPNRASVFNQDSLSSLLLSEIPEPEFDRGSDSQGGRSTRTSAAPNPETAAHPARNLSSASRRVHALWTTPIRFDSNSPTPVLFHTNTSLPSRAQASMNPAVARIAVPLAQSSTIRMPPSIVGIASIRNSSQQPTSATNTTSTASGTSASRAAPVRLNPSVRIAVPMIGATVRNLPTGDSNVTFAEQLARQVEENIRSMGASVSLLTNSRAGSPSSSTSQERSSNSREGITVRAPEQGTSPRAKKRKTETDTSSAPATSRALFNRSIPMNSINRTSWERIVAADVERQRNSPPRVCTFSRGYLAGGYCARTVSSLPRSSSFTGIVDNLTHLSVDGFPESPMTQNLDFLDEPD